MLWNDLITWRKAYSSLICSLGDRRQNGISRCLVMTQGLPGGVVVKNLPANAGDARDMGLIHGLGSSPGVGNGNSLQCSCLENSMDRGAWQATVHGVTKSWIWLSTYAHSCDDPVRDTTVGSVLVVVWGGLGRPYASTPVPLGSVIVYSAKDLGVRLRLRDLSRNKVLFLFHFYWLQIRGRICYQSLYITLAFICMSSYSVLWTVLHRILSDFTGKEMEAQAGSWLA